MALNPVDSTPVERSAARITPVVRSESLTDQTDLALPSNTAALRLASADRPTAVRGFNAGDAPTVPEFSIVNGDQVIAGSEKKPLSENALNAAKVKKGEGYFQSAERLLGGEFTHGEKKQFTDAMRKSWAIDHPDSKSLSRGDELLTEKNRDAILSNIADPALRARIAERLNKGLPEAGLTPAREPATDRVKKDRPAVENPDAKVKKPEVRIQPTDLDNVPDGPIRNPLERKFEVGDRFTGVTSTYGGKFNGRQTASKLRFNSEEMTAASKEFPFGTILSVTNPKTGKEVKVVITDNGPFAGDQVERPDGTTTYDRVIDISTRANRELGKPGLAPLNYKVLYVPENGAWGGDRRNLKQEPLQQLRETVRKYSR